MQKLVREGIHEPRDSDSDSEEQEERPGGVADALGGGPLQQAQCQRREKREEQQSREMAGSNDYGGQSTSPAGCDFTGVERAEDVYDSCRRNETSAVIARCARDVRTGGFEDPGEEIENA